MKPRLNSIVAIALATMMFATLNAVPTMGFAKGKEGHGGILVRVGNSWVPIEEAESYESGVFEGLSKLPSVSSSRIRPALRRSYGNSLNLWLEYLSRLSPGHADALRSVGSQTRFVYSTEPLSFRIVDEIETQTSYKEVVAAGMFVSGPWKGQTHHMGVDPDNGEYR